MEEIKIGDIVRRKDGLKIYSALMGKVTKVEIWDREGVDGKQHKVGMACITDDSNRSFTWHQIDLLEKVK